MHCALERRMCRLATQCRCTAVLLGTATMIAYVVYNLTVANMKHQETFAPFIGRLVDPSDSSIISSSFNSTDNFSCVNTSLSNLRFPICVYSAAEDTYVSSSFLQSGGAGYFEKEEVSQLLSLLRTNSDFEFIDIGANLGVFTLPAARLTNVIAVEPYWRSMRRLASSVKLGTVQHKVRLVQNAISSSRRTLRLGILPNNQGGNFLSTDINATRCQTKSDGSSCQLGPTIQSILLDDLLPLLLATSDSNDRRTAAQPLHQRNKRRIVMKVDVESHESEVFAASSASEFFRQVDVPIIYMEWFLVKLRPAVEVQRLLQFFYARNYSAFANSAQRSVLARSAYASWTNNIIFVRNGFTATVPPFME